MACASRPVMALLTEEAMLPASGLRSGAVMASERRSVVGLGLERRWGVGLEWRRWGAGMGVPSLSEAEMETGTALPARCTVPGVFRLSDGPVPELARGLESGSATARASASQAPGFRSEWPSGAGRARGLRNSVR